MSLTDFANILSTGETYYYELILNFLLWVCTVSFRVDWRQIKVDLSIKKSIWNFFATSFVRKTEHACNLSAR